MKVPRYKSLANELQEQIESGKYAVGDQLPPEMEICERHKVSRHTVRDALRILTDAGMVERRRGSGTTVLTSAPRPAFVQAIGGIGKLLEFAHDSRIEVRRSDVRPLTSAERRRLGVSGDEQWGFLDAIRFSGNTPLALSEIYIAGQFAGIINRIGHWQGAVQEIIASEFGVEVKRIEQQISAENLDAATARVLNTEPNAGALITLRKYFDDNDNLILASDNIMAGSRFVYSMTYHRDR